jgi:prevent-host-death family protein
MKMREIQASDAKTRLPELLRDVERGETLIITRHGKPIARLVPDPVERQARAEAAVARIREMAKDNGPITVEEILSARDEGRRF